VTSSFCLTKISVQMSDFKEQSGQTNNSSLTTGYTAPQAVEIINMFTTFYPPEQAKETLWQLLATSLSGIEGDGFTPCRAQQPVAVLPAGW
jgi:hypothetical protein